MSGEPRRWLESTEQPELRRLMRVGAEELAPADVLVRVGERLREAALASEKSAAPQLSEAESAPARAGTLGLGVKALGLTVLLGLAGFSLYLSLHASPRAPLRPSAPAEPDRAPQAEAARAAPPARLPQPVAPVELQVATPPDPSLAGAPPAQVALPHAAVRPRRARAQTAGVPSEPSAQPRDERLLEARLLEQARQELSTRPDHALAMLREQATQYPQSWLEEERSALLIRALAETGARAEARTQLTHFEARFPSSLHARRLEQMLAVP